MKAFKISLYCIITCIFLSSCGETKRILKDNYIYRYKDNQAARTDGSSADDSLYVYKLNIAIKSKIEDKTDYLILKNKKAFTSLHPIDSTPINPPVATKIKLNNSYYSTESEQSIFEKYQKSFYYTDLKFAIQTLSIPLKFRRALDDGTNYPQQVETGVNIGFAPVIKYNFNVYNPTKKIMGKSLNQYSINIGILINIGATDLKSASNAPGLISDRKAPSFTYGTFLMLGINNINFGYAIGCDKIIGEGSSNWVYQDKLWHGIIIALDIIKP